MNIKKFDTKKIAKYRIDKKNIEFLKSICSKSNIDPHELFYINANKYFSILQVFDYMENSSMGFLNSLIGDKNLLVTVDASSLSDMEYDSLMESSLKKQDNEQNETKKYTQYFRSAKGMQELVSFNNEIDNDRVTVKTMTVRIFVFAKTKEELQDKLDQTVNRLSKIKCQGYIQTNNLLNDYKSLTCFDNPVKKMVSSKTVAEIMMRSEISLVHKGVGLLGYTTNGLFALDPFLFENTSYGKAFIGYTGSGKSSLFKRLAESLELRGDHVQYLFDIHDEYKEFCEMNGMASVSINSSNYVNYCQIFYTFDSNGIISKQDITDKMASMLSSFMSLHEFDKKNPEDKKVIFEFSKIIRKYFTKYIGKNINDLKNEDWFLLSEPLEEIKGRLQNRKTLPYEENTIYTLELALEKMCVEFEDLYNRKTNMTFDLSKSIRFDFSFLRSTEDKTLKASYTEMFLNYVSYGFYLNMKKNHEEMKRLGIKEYQLTRPLFTCDCAIDEFTDYAESRSFLSNVVSRIKYARKAYSGLSFMVHATTDLTKGLEHNGDLLEEIFNLSIHKFLGESDGKTLKALRDFIPVLTDEDIKLITKFKKGLNGERQFFAVVNGKQKIPFTSIVTPYQRGYFGGGA